MPICDGSHAAEQWACRRDTEQLPPYVFVAASHDQNLAERLASELGGIAAHTVSGSLRAEQLVVLADGTALDEVKRLAARVDAPSRRAIAVGTEAALLARAFEGWPLMTADGEGVGLWRQLCDAVRGQATDVTPLTLQRAFVSHAVVDEPLISGSIDYLRRQLDADLFVCANSIAAGSSWHNTIVDQLRERPLLLLLLSKATIDSTFCAFEVGFAMALQKPIRIISIDGVRPPAYVQHLQMVDLVRRHATKPWLDRDDALVDALIHTLR